jgi:hypothetical protein
VCAAFGGLSKQAQFKELRAGADVAVCTPGRMIDLIKMKACGTKRITYVVSLRFAFFLSFFLYLLFPYFRALLPFFFFSSFSLCFLLS